MPKEKKVFPPNAVIEIEFKDDGFCKIRCEAQDIGETFEMLKRVKNEIANIKRK